MMDQLSLVFFTVLAQTAVGMFVALGLFDLLGKPDAKSLNKPLLVVWGIMAVGALASVTHLAQPLRMFNVLMGVSHGSALSLEIVALALFGGAGVAFTGMRLFNIAPFGGMIQKIVLLVAMALGVALIKAIANVYTLETVPTWNSGWTTFQFMMTAALAGPVGAAALLRWETKTIGSLQVSADKALATTGCMMLTVAIAGYAGYLFWLGQLSLTVNPFTLFDYHLNLVVARVALLMVGLLIWAITAMRGANKNTGAAAMAFALVVVSELLGRVFFYDMMISASTGM